MWMEIEISTWRSTHIKDKEERKGTLSADTKLLPRRCRVNTQITISKHYFTRKFGRIAANVITITYLVNTVNQSMSKVNFSSYTCHVKISTVGFRFKLRCKVSHQCFFFCVSNAKNEDWNLGTRFIKEFQVISCIVKDEIVSKRALIVLFFTNEKVGVTIRIWLSWNEIRCFHLFIS